MTRRGFASAFGQAGTEYTLLISVAVIAVVAASFVYVPKFREGTFALGKDVSGILATHQINGVGGSYTGTGSTPPGGGSPGAVRLPQATGSGSLNAGSGPIAAGNGGAATGPGTARNPQGNLEGGNTGGVALAAFAGARASGGTASAFVPPLGQPPGGASQATAQWLAEAGKAAGIDSPQLCSQYALWRLLPGTLKEITSNTVQAGLTNQKELKQPRFGMSFFGMNVFGTQTTKVTEGKMTLDWMQQHLVRNGFEARNRQSSVADLEQMLRDRHTPVLILDASQVQGSSCASLCGHTVTVTAVDRNAGTVRVTDPFGTYDLPLDQFSRGWAENGNRVVDVAPKAASSSAYAWGGD